MALEESFITLIINHARIEQLSAHALDSRQPGRQIQALKDIMSLVQDDETAMEEARKAHLAPALTRVLAKTKDEDVLDATSSLIAVLSGAVVHRERVLTIAYPEVGQIAVHECSLGEGVGARLWGISHAFNKYLISNRQAIEGTAVLEIGSGVGSTGVVAAKLDALSVTVTDLTAQLLRNLRETILRNFPPQHPASPSSTPPAASHPGATQEAHPQPPDLEFTDAESVSDETELFAGDGRSDGAGGDRGSVAQTAEDEAAAGWDFGRVRVRVMDWKVEWDAWAAGRGVSALGGVSLTEREDDTTSALDASTLPAANTCGPNADDVEHCDGGHCAVVADDAAQQSGRLQPLSPRDTFDVPGDVEGLPPAVPVGACFGVVLGCEVLYEVPHAAWVAATVARRLEAAGTAWIAGAVRDRVVYDAFEEHLHRCGLQFVCEPISPAEGFQGLGNKEDIYDDGYRLYCIRHR